MDQFAQLLLRVRDLEIWRQTLVLPEVGIGTTWSGTGIAAVAETVLAAGTITKVVTVTYAAAEETGSDTGGGVVTLELGDAANIVHDGTNVCTLTCTVGGALQVARSAGADTYAVNLWAVWV